MTIDRRYGAALTERTDKPPLVVSQPPPKELEGSQERRRVTGMIVDPTDQYGILLTGKIPTRWLRWLNFVDATKAFLKHDAMQLNWDGTATYAGTLGTGIVTTDAIAPGAVIASKLTANAQAFGTNIVFSATDYRVVAWTSGSLKLANGTEYTIASGNTGNMTVPLFIYFDPTVSTTVLQTTAAYGAAAGENVVIICFAQPSVSTVQKAMFIPVVGVVGMNSDNIGSKSISTDKLQANSVTAAEISVAQLSAISADIGVVTAGRIEDAGGDYGVLLSGTVPGGWTRWLNLVDASKAFLKHEALELRQDGSAEFGGHVRSQVGDSATLADPVQLVYQNKSLSTGSTTEVSLASFSLPANVLSANGDLLRITLIGDHNIAGGQVNIKFGATSIATQAFAADFFQFQLYVIRTGASAQLGRGSLHSVLVGAAFYVSAPGETLSGAVTVDFRGNAGAAGTLNFDSVIVEYLGA